MRKTMWVVALAIAATFAPAVLRAGTITYTVNETVGGGSVIGTITTDGNTGTLLTADIIDWNLTVNDGVSSFNLLGPLSGSNSTEEIVNSALTASATQLSYNFSAGTLDWLLIENPSVGGDGPAVCWTNDLPDCYGAGTGGGVLVTAEFPATTFATTTLTGTQVIASTATTPEPGSLTLLAVGLLVLMRKRLVSAFR
jgi:hypothetical protein